MASREKKGAVVDIGDEDRNNIKETIEKKKKNTNNKGPDSSNMNSTDGVSRSRPIPDLRTPLPPLKGAKSVVTNRTVVFDGKVKRSYEDRPKAYWNEPASTPQPWERKKLQLQTITGYDFSLEFWCPDEQPIYKFPKTSMEKKRVEVKDERTQFFHEQMEKLRNLETHALLIRQKLRQMRRQEPLSREEMKKGVSPSSSSVQEEHNEDHCSNPSTINPLSTSTPLQHQVNERSKTEASRV
eukprot:m.103773 g.103773  ORF g.103773 m.103773 type:complete len:240 (-) comp12622_c0_seq12:1488-2207(-)